MAKFTLTVEPVRDDEVTRGVASTATKLTPSVLKSNCGSEAGVSSIAAAKKVPVAVLPPSTEMLVATQPTMQARAPMSPLRYHRSWFG